MNEEAMPDKARTARILEKFDRVLKRHIRRLLDTSEPDINPAYGLKMIACMLLLSEREKEIADFPGAATKRYNRQSFLKDIDEIGFIPDDLLMVDIQDLSQAGYIHIGADEEYRARDPAIKFLSLMDGIFPTLPGLSLIAYTLQAVEEVLSGRKEIMLALRQFDETLLTRGVSISKQRVELMRRQRAEAARKQDDPSALKQREAYLERLRALRARMGAASSDPFIVTTSGYVSNVVIRELFPRESDTPEFSPRDTPQAQAPATPDDSPPPAPENASEKEVPPAPVMDAPVVTTPAQPMPVEETWAQASPEEENEDVSEGEREEELSEEEIIAQKIQAFEELLAMSCPVCKEGKILSSTTEKEKTYYYCSNKSCNLITWGRPYHISCPICQSPFLIEFEQPEGGVGLKCPRATCAFQHKDFDSRQPPVFSTPGGVKTVRKVAVRKKAGQKTVRRVVRRKG